MKYHKRVVEPLLKEYLTAFPVVGITGPRQAGKSTLLNHCLGKQYEYVTFDSQEHLDRYYDDPKRFMEQHSDNVIFDEVQKAPEIFNDIKILVDKDRDRYGKFVLTGSSQFSFIKKITESLAGRIGLLTLLPFQCSEIPKSLHKTSLFKGGYPELINRQYAHSDAWFSSYITTYLEKDVRYVSQIGDIRDFSRLIRLLGARCSQLLDMSSLANDLGVTVMTVKRWISVLEASYIIFLLPPYYKNHGKRLIKSPKIYFYDTGLAAYLTRTTTEELFEEGPLAGNLFENYIISEVKKSELHRHRNSELCFYRTSHGQEVDLIIDRFQQKEVIEIKSSHTFKPKMTEQVEKLLEKGDQGYLLYRGKSFDYDKNLKALNYSDYLEKN